VNNEIDSRLPGCKKTCQLVITVITTFLEEKKISLDCYTPKIEAAHTSEMSVNIYQSSRCHILYDLNHQQHRCSNCKSLELFINFYKKLDKSVLVITLQCS